jgi:RHS repeat-associated protein
MRQFRLICIAVVVGLALFCSASIPAQSDPDFETGLKPFGSYHGGNIDTVNLSNGSLNIDIPLMSYPQRGGKLKLGFDFRMSNFSYYYTVGYISCPDESGNECATTDWETPGDFVGFTQESVPIATSSWTDDGSEYLGQSQITTPDQAIHQMGLTALTGGYWRTGDATGYAVAGNYYTLTGPVTDSSGLKYTSAGYIPSGWQAASVEDANENQISVQTGGGYYGTEVTQWTDSLGRTIPAPASTTDYSRCPNSSGTTSAMIWNFPGYNGQQQGYPVLFCYGSVPISFYYWYVPPDDGTGWQAQQSYNVSMLQYIVLPDNTYWTFAYTTDGNGNPAQITFPTGGALCYKWNNFVGGNPDSNYQMESQVASRILDPSGTCSQSSPTWTYQRVGPSGGNVTVTDPAGNNTVHHFAIPAGLQTDYETETDYPAGKTVYNTFSSAGTCGNIDGAVLTQTETLWSNGQESKIQYGYDSGFSAGQPWETDNPPPYNPVLGGGSCLYGLQTSKQEYDFGASSPTRTTTTSYQYQNNTNYLAPNLLDLPASVQVTGVGPGSYTTYGYDESNCTSGLCGNQTSVHDWLNTTGGYLTTSSVYNSNGLVTSVRDPKSNPTTYQYSSGYAGTGPTSITNALGQTTSYAYDLNTGVVNSVKDPNGQITGLTTSYQYDDMLRTTEIDYPDGGQTLYGYPGATEVQLSEKINPSGTYKTTNLLVDGLGRLSQTQLTSDPEGIDYTLTTYDGMGRKYQVYNPTRCSTITTNCGESTWGYTTYQYDPLSRPMTVTEQDGSVVSTSYSGSYTTVTDEAGNIRQNYTDALGRLSSVTENPSGLNYLTTYSYDALDDLTGVTQVGSHQRSFVYDSLSRITSAYNPESGSTSYSYDANGNVITKTDARGTVTCYGNWSGSCDGLGYDQLNRVTQKAYSDTTVVAKYFYDQSDPMGWPLPNTIGRMSSYSLWDTGTNNWVSGTCGQFGYDPMGRVQHDGQCRPVGGMDVLPLYDLLGDMTSYNLNYAGITIAQTFDTAGRLTQIGSTLSDALHPATLWRADATQGYYPHGDLEKAALGNGLFETVADEPRLQTCRIDLNTSGGVPDGCSGSLPSGMWQNLQYVFGNWGSTNNGNVTGFYGIGVQNFSRSYAYDALNRLQSMSAPGDPCSGLSWTIDPWANRTDQSVTSGSCNTFHQSIDGNNHLMGYSYDAAGNLLNDGVHSYSYDEENRITKVDGGSTANYSYDALGRRMEKSVGGINTEYIYGIDGNVVLELDGNGNWQTGYVNRDGHTVAQYANGNTYFIHKDLLGSTRLETGPATVDVRFTNDSCSGCGGGTPVGGGDRNLYVNSVTVDSTPISPGDPSVMYTAVGCNSFSNGVGTLLCAGDMFVPYSALATATTITVNAYGSPDYNIYPHMQLLVAGKVIGEWDVTGSAQNYGVTVPSNVLVIDTMDYLPFGEEVAGWTTTTHRFTSKEHDSESNLDDFGARYYSSSVGRFMTPDWAGKPTAVPYANFGNPQSLNLYSYVENNPTTTGDPDGHCFEDACALEGGTGVVVVGIAALTAADVYLHTPSAQRSLSTFTSAFTDTVSSDVHGIKNTVSGWFNSTEQGRDAQGKFLPKQEDQTQPGTQAEKDALAAEGATKNTKPIPGSNRIPDGTLPDGSKVEVKSGQEISNTEQLREMGQAHVDQYGKPLTVVTTNPNVTVTKDAQQNPNLKIRPLNQPQDQ